jgi:hypothetical protein
MIRALKAVVLIFFILFILPVAIYTGLTFMEAQKPPHADLSNSRFPEVTNYTGARILIVSARMSGLRASIATHSWIVLKRDNASSWTRYDVLPWGGSRPQVNTWAPEASWFGRSPTLIADIRGKEAAALIPRIEAAIGAYEIEVGEYRWWPGPNSNTFVEAALRAVPELATTLPPTSIGKDFRRGPYGGLTDSRTGLEVSLSGVIGVKIGWIEGLEVNILGLVAGLDLRHPALKLPGFGRVGLP